MAEDWSNSTMWLINANELHSKLYKAPHEDKWECAAAQKRRQVHLEDQTAIEQIEFARMDVSGCNQSLCLAVAVTVCSVVHCSYSYLMKSMMLIFVNGSNYMIYLYYVNQAFIVLRKELWINSVKDVLNTIKGGCCIWSALLLLDETDYDTATLVYKWTESNQISNKIMHIQLLLT